MDISIFGLGYVGCVSAACLSSKGHSVVGVDVSEHKVNLINNGTSPIIENGLDDLIKQGSESGLLHATTDGIKAVLDTNISIICVGTPNKKDGSLNLEFIFNVVSQIAEGLKQKDSFHVIVIRSTVAPKTSQKAAELIESITSKKRNVDFGIVSNPEFLREGTALKDYNHPPYTLIGSASEKALDIMEEVYKDIDAPIYRTDTEVAEIIKYVNNSFHALKVVFANEIGNICKNLGIDSHKVMEIFCKDTILNISPYYLKPGFAYGGSCLPKDLSALVNLSRQLHLETPILNNIERSNEIHKENALDEIIEFGKMKIGFLGLSFKPGTDDLRHSPSVEIIERLIGKGYKVFVYDSNVELSKLVGTNKSYIESKLPHLSELLVDIETLFSESEVIVLANKEEEFKNIFECYLKEDFDKIKDIIEEDRLKKKVIFDLVRITKEIDYKGEYSGICW